MPSDIIEVQRSARALWESLARTADAAGEGPNTKRKNSFRNDADRQSFIEAWGQKAYDNLK